MAKKAAAQAPPDDNQILQLDPSMIVADDNTRFGLKESRIQALAASILAQGGVMVPVEVEPVDGGFKLVTGFYRTAAVKYLNTTGAGLTVPATVHVSANAAARLSRQLAENMERENQSPMDQAIAICKLMDNGISREDIRAMFSRPGGRKGNKVQPASNSFINMTLSFLELPKKFQTAIHEGTIGVSGAYELTKISPDKREEVLEKAKEQRDKDMEREERDEERFLASQKKLQANQTKLAELTVAKETAEKVHSAAVEELKVATLTATEAYNTLQGSHVSTSAKKESDTAFKAAEKIRQVAEKAEIAAKKELDSTTVAYEKHTLATSTEAKTLRDEKAAAPKGAATKTSAVSGADVKKAAKETGATSGAVALTLKEIRDVITELALPGGNEDVIAVGTLFNQCILGQISSKQLYKKLEGLFG